MSTPQFETIGKYVLLEKLAMGGMAEVFLSRALGAGGISKFFAIKRILPQYADSPEFIDMFREEAKIAINLKHSNIVSIHEFGIQEQQFFLVMDFVEGRNLRQILNKMKKAKVQFPTEHIIFLIREIAAGLDHAHRCIDSTTGRPLNITHRDMSPQNVMISFDGEVKIVDFGIAKAESQVETTRAGTLKGKFGYMSPEQAEGLSVDSRTDIFSLGIVMWEILANDRLFAANNEINTLRKIRDCHIPSLRKINPNIHGDLEKIVQKALARDKNLRYQSAAALHKDLNRFLNRQYPDFSSHDFAGYIKTIFADEILSSRKKLVTYAKSSVVNVAVNGSVELADDKTIVTEPSNVTQTSSYVVTETEVPQDDETSGQHQVSLKSESVPSIQTIASLTKTGVKAKNVLDSSIFPDTRSEVKTPTQARLPESTSSGIINRPTHKSITAPEFKESYNRFAGEEDPSAILQEGEENNKKTPPPLSASRVNIPVRVKRERRPLSSGINLMIVLVIGFFGSIKFFPGPMSGVIESTEPLFSGVYGWMGVSGSNHPASKSLSPDQSVESPAEEPPISSVDQRRAIIVVSNPSGAEIYVNGVKTGQITPSRLTIPDDTFTLGLTRKGFESVKTQVSASDPNQKHSFILKKLKLGFIDVEVKPLQEVQVFVDGRRVTGEALPLRNYPVSADRNVEIRVVGKNGQTAQSHVSLQENQKQSLTFTLGQPVRTPARK